jgi:hypothetical protein
MNTEPSSHAALEKISPVAHIPGSCAKASRSPFTPPGGNNETPPEAVDRAGRAAGLYGRAQDRVKTRSWGLVMLGDSMYTYQSCSP